MSCPNCFTGTILEGEPKGKNSAFEGAYLAPAPEPTSKRAIIFLTDIFGLPLVNCRLMADAMAGQLGCDVWVLDLFQGNPPVGLNQLKVPDRAGVHLGFFGTLRVIFSILPSIPALVRNRPSVCQMRVEAFIKKLQAEKHYASLGAVGYCFGGRMATELGSTDLVNSIVLCHPSAISQAMVEAIKVPASFACAEDDLSFSTAARNNAEASMAARKGKPHFVDYEFKDYKGTAHGFAARPNLAVPEVKAGFEGSFQQTVEWFNRTLPA